MVVLLLAGCAQSTAAPGAAPSAPGSPAASSQVLLDRQDETVLDQDIFYPDGQAEVSSALVRIPVGGSTGRHRHNAPMYAYVLTGQVEVTYDDGSTKTLTAGDALIEAVGTWHEGRNPGSEEVQILTVNMGAEGLVNTEKTGSGSAEPTTRSG